MSVEVEVGRLEAPVAACAFAGAVVEVCRDAGGKRNVTLRVRVAPGVAEDESSTASVETGMSSPEAPDDEVSTVARMAEVDCCCCGL
jgi:hypothetical protein